MIVTCDGWYDIQVALDKQFEDQYGLQTLSRVVVMIIILIGHFVIFNIFIG